MPYSQDDLDTLTEYREGIVAALEKANEAIKTLNAAIERTGANHETVAPIDEQTIHAVDQTRLENRAPFEAAREEVREHLGPNTTDGPRAIKNELEAYDTKMKRAHRHLEEYLEEQKLAQSTETSRQRD